MIHLNKVNKYFFRRKKNEIHAIDNTSLDLQEAQLVALLGPSGCGKTTLLNAIGGLDKIDRGEIFIDGEKISSRFSGKVDRIRTLKIGYIFQNYNLIDHMTVFENVAIALQMIGVKNRNEISSRVNYVLEKVGMYRYRNRRADMLSGGERQRVGIARAIVKNPQIIIADEPTGNLDSRNTLEVMNIIKSISRERLVILVTHEQELADFYADRIIRVKDGKVESNSLNGGGELNYRIDNRIYLKDIPHRQKLSTDLYNINFYNRGGVLDLNIIVDEGKVYIQPMDGTEIEVVGEQSAVEVVDDHDRGMSQEEMKRQAIDLKRLDTFSKRKYTSILNPWTLLKRGFRTIGAYPLLKKVLLAGFFLSAAVITLSVAIFFGVFQVDEGKFTTTDRSYVTIGGKSLTPDKYEEYEKSGLVRYMLPGDSLVSMQLDTDTLYQTKSKALSFQGSLSDITKLKESDIVSGKMPKSAGEIVIDRKVVSDLLRGEEWVSVRELNITSAEDCIGRQLSVPNAEPFTIAGVTDQSTPCIYVHPDVFVPIVTNAPSGEDDGGYDEYIEAGMEDFEYGDEMGESFGEDPSGGELVDIALKYSSVGIVQGEWPKQPYEVMTNYWTSRGNKAMKLGTELKRKVNGHKLKIVGYYSDRNQYSTYLVTEGETVKLAAIEKLKKATICPAGSKQELIQQLKADGFKVTDPYAKAKKDYYKEHQEVMKSILIFSGIMLLISLVEIFLMIRTSFLSRIKEVGIYRAIGVKKKDIYKMFSGEIIAISLAASLPGYLIMLMVLRNLSGNPTLGENFMFTPETMLLALILILGLNLFFGLIPVGKTIRKSPAAILARTDVN